MRVQEVLDMESLTEVPGGPKSLLGVINLRVTWCRFMICGFRLGS